MANYGKNTSIAPQIFPFQILSQFIIKKSLYQRRYVRGLEL